MIRKVTVRHFKMFKQEEFKLSEHVLLAGPNNSGKTTLLQAIATWHLAINKWIENRTGKTGQTRTGVPIPKKDFTAIPLRDVRLLWTDLSVALGKDEAPEGKAGYPRFLEVRVEWEDKEGIVDIPVSFRSQGSEIVYVRLETESTDDLLNRIRNINVVHVPPFSGIGVDETRYDRPYQNLLVGQGKAGDILRNLLLEIYTSSTESWDELCSDIKTIFGCRLLSPEYEGRPFIVCDYLPGIPDGRGQGGLTKLDIASAGSGFHQVLMLLSFFYARPASIYLLDEPDAHLHVILQKQVHDRLRDAARNRHCQLIISTHSEILIDRSDIGSIISFFERPHHLSEEAEQARIREALKRITATEALLADHSPFILYVESQSDFDILKALSEALKHPIRDWFSNKPFYYAMRGRKPRTAREHFFALGAIRSDIKGYLILDSDNRETQEHEVKADRLVVKEWKRYEIENYLVHFEALVRFVENRFPLSVRPVREYLENQLPPAFIDNPLEQHDYIDTVPASKTLLPGFMKASGLNIQKNEYFLIAQQMKPDEIPDEITRTLDDLYGFLKLGADDE
ncbi:MAG: AAA family ATPase [Myxococcota bacterium]|nr:AAA family ATPase [Myxococcota bacterium]